MAALIFAAFGLTAIVQAQGIDGGFGENVGDRVDSGLSAIVNASSAPSRYFDFTPDSPNPNLTYYSVSVTPECHLIFEIVSTGDFPSQASINDLMKTLEAKYGPFKWSRLGEPPLVIQTGLHAVGSREI